MRAASRKRTDTSEQACIACRNRKTRCIMQPGNTSCSHCIRVSKTCVFSGPASRTPLTRKNLDDLETRCRNLEAQLARMTHDASPAASAQLMQPATSTPNMPERSGIANTQSVGDETQEVQSSIDHSETAYEWNERLSSPDGNTQHSADGMASLTVRDRQRGYLGNSSGSSLLETISSTLPKNTLLEIQPSSQLGSPPYFSISKIRLAHGLSSSVVRESLIEAYFRHYNTSYPILHQDTFRRACNKQTSLSHDSIWHVIYFMVLAIGEWVSGFNEDSISLYYDAARSRLNINALEAGTMSTVQAFLLLSNYLQKTDKPNTAYNFSGIAYRVALGLGLHREITTEQKPETCALQQRRLIFWTLYSFDSGFSLTTGRPIMVADCFIDSKKPLNIDDSKSRPTSLLPAEVSYPTTSSAMVAQSRLAVIANRIHNTFQSVNVTSDLEHSALVMGQALKDWKESLPSYFTSSDVPEWFLGPRAMVLWKASNINLVLLIASQKGLVDPHSHRKYGTKSCELAVESIDIICDFCERHRNLLHHGLTWYVVYYILQCLLAIEAQRTHAQQGVSTMRMKQPLPNVLPITTARARRCLLELSQTNKPAARVIQLLDHIRNQAQSTQRTAAGNTGNDVANNIQPTQSPVTYDFNSQANRGEASNYPTEPSMTITNNSPQSPFGSNIFSRTWMMAADPSLHMFIDGSNDLGTIFDDLGGFPGTNDGDNFSYYLGGNQF